VAFLALRVRYLRCWRDPAARVFLMLGGAYPVAVLLTRVWWHQLVDLTGRATCDATTRSCPRTGCSNGRAAFYARVPVAQPADGGSRRARWYARCTALPGRWRTASGYRLELVPPGWRGGRRSVQGALTSSGTGPRGLGRDHPGRGAALVLRYRATADARAAPDALGSWASRSASRRSYCGAWRAVDPLFEHRLPVPR
jgi:hypothetical protein